MQTHGEVTAAVPQDAAFAYISDPFKLAANIPGCSDLHEIGPNRYGAVLANKVGFISVKFNVVVEITKNDPPSAIDATIGGDAPGIGGRLTAAATVRLEPLAEGTRIRYTVEMGLTGKLGGIAQPVFRAKSDELGKRFGANLKTAIEESAGAART